MRSTSCTMLYLLGALLVPDATIHADTLLQSEPSGAWVAMNGSVSVAGIAPIPIDELPAGTYDFSATGPGLPAVRGRFRLTDRSIRRSGWAGPVALVLPPGLSHLQNGEQRGWAFLAAGALGGGMFAHTMNERSQADDELDRARSAYSAAVSASAIRESRDRLEIARMRRDDERELSYLWLGYTAVTWTSAAVESWLLTPQPRLGRGSSGGYRVALPSAAPWKSALRSSLVPGAGQRYMGRSGRASLFSTGVALAGAGAIFAHQSFLDARREQALEQARYDRATTSEELTIARDRLSDAASRTDDRNALRWICAVGAAGIYLWNVVDAWLVGDNGPVLSTGNATSSSPVSIGLVPSPDGMLAAATWRLP